MPQDRSTHRLYELFARMLEYPTPDLGEQARLCATLLPAVSPEAAEHAAAFADFVAETSPSRLEEIYTGTFDLQVICFPYVGYQLFGESYKRGAFLVKLKEEYRAHGFVADGELPDHLAVILRFMATLKEVDAELEQDLIGVCLAPALGRMEQSFEGKPGPYGDVIRALVPLLRGTLPGDGPDAARENDRQVARL